MKKQVMIYLVLILMVGVVIFQQFNNRDKNDEAASADMVKIGAPAPVFQLKDLNDVSYAIPEPNGKPVLINFWATWCGPCRIEMPDLVELYDQYQDEVAFYAVNLTGNDKVNEVISFADEYELSFPVLLDQELKVSKAYNIYAVPSTIFIDRHGNVMDQVLGLVDHNLLEGKIKNLLK